jgi:1,3-beta-glucanosyltransferase GAS5
MLVNTPNNAINRDDPANSYNAIYLQHVFATIDAFKEFPHTLGFFSGNEVVNNVNNSIVVPARV